jgi:multiple sugar transport system ATP-binding protein
VPDIFLKELTKVYKDGTKAVDGVTLTIPDGSLCVLVGPSGCGKTTLLRLIAGLEDITGGTVTIGGIVMNDVAPKDRDLAMVFQNYALYPHMTVYDNLAFGLKLRHERRRVIDQGVRHAASLLGLDDLLEKKPRHLSGGQRQRVAMGRAIVRQPEAFLMDEPLSNLDAKLRVQMRAEIARIQRELQSTMIYVTHDQTEAMTLGDLVVVMNHGVIQQVDGPQSLYRNPGNLFVAGFIGSPPMNVVEAELVSGRERIDVVFGSSRLELPSTPDDTSRDLMRYLGKRVVLGVRPEHLHELRAGSAHEFLAGTISTRVEIREDLGFETLVHVFVDGSPPLTQDIRDIAMDTDAAALDLLEENAAERRSTFIARVEPDSEVREGEPIDLGIDARHLYFFDVDTGEAISTSMDVAKATRVV